MFFGRSLKFVIVLDVNSPAALHSHICRSSGVKLTMEYGVVKIILLPTLCALTRISAVPFVPPRSLRRAVWRVSRTFCGVVKAAPPPCASACRTSRWKATSLRVASPRITSVLFVGSTTALYSGFDCCCFCFDTAFP
ncbi:hypothetical protein DQ04_01481150 [Trypanosoma grayi]|uniref:hypothetical protein n=1 Tax=Trypanosoma grayi TaxID=71804 RepID=UPI0004F42902|nr:hypothetical protein DQ04_01481150 [Trypanosoma grayi]KEG12712.1 hypothetical protein DQ04_01481150 [Trypanosoma grayi]